METRNHKPEVTAFSLSMSGLGISGEMGKKGKGARYAMGKDTLRGTVTRVDGNTVTLRGEECQERKVLATKPMELKDIRVGITYP